MHCDYFVYDSWWITPIHSSLNESFQRIVPFIHEMVYYVICTPNVVTCNNVQAIILLFCARLPPRIDFEGLHGPHTTHCHVSIEMWRSLGILKARTRGRLQILLFRSRQRLLWKHPHGVGVLAVVDFHKFIVDNGVSQVHITSWWNHEYICSFSHVHRNTSRKIHPSQLGYLVSYAIWIFEQWFIHIKLITSFRFLNSSCMDDSSGTWNNFMNCCLTHS